MIWNLFHCGQTINEPNVVTYVLRTCRVGIYRGSGHSSMSSITLLCKNRSLILQKHFISSWSSWLQLVLWRPHSPVLCFDQILIGSAMLQPSLGTSISRGHLPTRSLSRSGCTHYHCKRAEVRSWQRMVFVPLIQRKWGTTNCKSCWCIDKICYMIYRRLCVYIYIQIDWSIHLFICVFINSLFIYLFAYLS